MEAKQKLLDLKARTYKNATECIMPFWKKYMTDTVKGGFYGAVDKNLNPIENAPRSAVLMTRMLWAYSNAYDVTKDEAYAELAKREYIYVRDHFWDPVYGGVYWMVGPNGDPFDTMKRTYAQACFLYAVSEYYYVFRDKEALDYAMKILDFMYKYVRQENGAYLDSVCRDWQVDPWVRTWFMNGGGAPFLLNSHLHLFEGIALLYRCTKDEKVKNILKEFLVFLLDNCVEYDTGHLKAGMNEKLCRIDHEISYGHDLECAYLMEDAARFLEEPELIEKTNKVVLMLAKNALDEALDGTEGGMFNEKNAETNEIMKSKIWWVQCESITGFLCAYEISGDEIYLDGAIKIYDYVEKYMSDWEKGEWYAVGKHASEDPIIKAMDDSLFIVVGDEKANKTKCPYHNSRSCFGVSERVDRLLKKMS